jgi:excisionase family DNA binding protein
MSKIAVLSEEELIELIKVAAAAAVSDLRDEIYKPIPELMNIKQVSKYLQCSSASVSKWVKTDGLPAHNLGNLPRFYKAEVDEWLKNSNRRRKGIVSGKC